MVLAFTKFFRRLIDKVMDEAGEPKEVRSELRSILESYPDAHSEDEKIKKQQATVKRFLGTLKSLGREIEQSGIVSKKIAREIDQLIAKIEKEL